MCDFGFVDCGLGFEFGPGSSKDDVDEPLNSISRDFIIPDGSVETKEGPRAAILQQEKGNMSIALRLPPPIDHDADTSTTASSGSRSISSRTTYSLYTTLRSLIEIPAPLCLLARPLPPGLLVSPLQSRSPRC